VVPAGLHVLVEVHDSCALCICSQRVPRGGIVSDTICLQLNHMMVSLFTGGSEIWSELTVSSRISGDKYS
jgi:hypothetical protein